MRLRATLLGLTLVLWVCVLGAPDARSACAAASPISGTGADGSSFLWTARVFAPRYYVGYPPAMYGADARAPVTSELQGVFWALGRGNPAPGAGDDSGSYYWAGGGGIVYSAVPGYDLFYAAEIETSWSDPRVDGCIGPDACGCILLTDQDGGVGYFALLAARSNAFEETFVNRGGADPLGNELPIVLVPMPRPNILAVVEDPVTLDRVFTLRVHPVTAGYYRIDDCDCAPTGYRLFEQVVASGSPAPLDRDVGAGWTPVTLDGGGAMPVTTPGETVAIRVECGALDNDVYFGTRLFFDSGFSTPIVSGSERRIRCGPNADQPLGPPPRPRPGRPTAKPGAGGSR